MVKTARACCSLAILACSSRRFTTAFVSNTRFTGLCPASDFRALIHSSTPFRSNRVAAIHMSTEETSAVDVASNLDEVKQRMQACLEEMGALEKEVTLVAVSKTKPTEMLMQAYDAGQRIFGENYVQELVGKATEMPKDIKWHFIGPLQSNKANLLVKSVPNLCVETVATLKLANKLNNAVQQLEGDAAKQPLDIFVQVNTSGEESKSGTEPGEKTISLCRDIVANCPMLNIRGLMTIGMAGDTSCFDVLVKCRDEMSKALELSTPLELSMGMSGDFEDAMKHGATSVRVGSTIFGQRDYSNLNK